ncbi:hypothetical protein Lfu02_78330 [Longispora fulva]|uniref:F5/8 type C domain-containing protein n=1 Tax=Longispora fulva TaxID=619741 RepID=A0A8J7KFM2_9ACTN|nr:discoidin domain-containing protein [Longispora fulva]MBG6136365.1 hypothetical protein [Longispora fulva]GIG63461.1 hypothetical protein Lfu02_78330 [Longispora fulva]
MTFNRLSPATGRRSVAAAATLLTALGAGVVFATAAHAATQVQLYAAPNGSGTTCAQAAPCTITQAKNNVAALTASMTGDIVVNLNDGTYPLTAPLTLGPADSGQNSFKVRWQAAPGARPVLSGAATATSWTQVGSTGIWKSTVGSGVDFRQVYVNNDRAVRARGNIQPAGFTKTSTGYTTTAGASLAMWMNPSAIEFSYRVAWTYSRCPVGSVSGTTITMAQPCWTHAHSSPYLQNDAPLWIENAYELLDAPGEWYLDKTGAVGNGTGVLYYKPKPGESMTGTSAVTVTYPNVERLLSVAGTGTASRVHDLQFVGLTFADATWLRPNTSEGFAEEQSNFTQVGPNGSHWIFDGATKTPGAVAITYARDILIQGGTFTRLGGAGVDVEKSSYNVTLLGNTVFDVSGNGIQVGDITPQDQRPTNFADRMHDVIVRDNYVHDVAVEFRGGVGIFGGFVDTLKLLHNEVANVSYTGISVGWGWGYLDNGGTGDGTVSSPPDWQPHMTTATIAQNNVIDGNYVHEYMAGGHDGGAVYTLGAQPNSTETNNYYASSGNEAGARGIYLDNGTKGYTVSGNVVDRVDSWVLVNEGGGASSLDNPAAQGNTITGNWANTTNKSCCSAINTYTNNTDTVSGSAWPSGAAAVIAAAGLETNATDSFGVTHNWATELKGTPTVNLAPTATASASNIYSGGYSAANATDGSSKTRWATSGGTTSATLTLTFPQAKNINRVVLREAQYYEPRIATYTIDYWNGTAWTAAATGLYPRTSQALQFPTVNTTQIRLNITSSASGPTVQEFEVYAPTTSTNVAQGSLASQSSTDYSGAASRAVDGNTDGAFYNGSVTHTGIDANAWWQVDLATISPVSQVSVWNRTDCCANRLSDYWVFVSASPFNTALTPTQQASQPGVWSNHQTTQAGSPTTITTPANTTGRYVMIQLAGTNNLSLTEVQVYS